MSEAKKFDGEKPMWNLMPFRALDSVAQILTFGSKKYGDRNWEKGDIAFAERCLAASFRHLSKRMQGRPFDEESHLPHLAHAACDILMALELMLRHKEDSETSK